MRTLKIYLNHRKSRILFPLLAIMLSMFSCTEDILEEVPLSKPNDKSTLTSKAGFEAYLIGLVRNAREEYTENDTKFFLTNFAKTDVGEEAGAEYAGNRNWITYLTPLTDEVLLNWNWAYKEMIPQANTVITYASLPEIEEIWADEAEKNAIIAEARFFRGYTYNFLANLFGGVPIVEVVETNPKFE
jgi:starch-binding outer membrane protein, SusD/RagB family